MLSLRHEYLLRATCFSQKQPASVGEISFRWGNQPPLKTSQLFQHSKNPPSSGGNYVSLEKLCTLPRKCRYSLGLMHLHMPPCNHYFIDIYVPLQCCHIVDKYKFMGLF
jgi:hypothetical protein